MRPYATGLRDHRALWRLVLATVLVVCFLLGFVTGTAYAAEQPPAVQTCDQERCIRAFEVRPGVMLRMRRYDIEARVRIEQHPGHRTYTVAFDSDTGPSGSQSRELNTRGPDELSPVTQDPHRWRHQPGARYQFALAVYGAGGKLLDRRTAEIRTPDDPEGRGVRR